MCKHFSFNPYAHTQCSFYDSDCYSLKGFRPFFRHLNKLNKPLHDPKKKKTLMINQNDLVLMERKVNLQYVFVMPRLAQTDALLSFAALEGNRWSLV